MSAGRPTIVVQDGVVQPVHPKEGFVVVHATVKPRSLVTDHVNSTDHLRCVFTKHSWWEAPTCKQDSSLVSHQLVCSRSLCTRK